MGFNRKGAAIEFSGKGATLGVGEIGGLTISEEVGTRHVLLGMEVELLPTSQTTRQMLLYW
jgi:hypothetical protein